MFGCVMYLILIFFFLLLVFVYKNIVLWYGLWYIDKMFNYGIFKLLYKV